jgi:hypothetical protein
MKTHSILILACVVAGFCRLEALPGEQAAPLLTQNDSTSYVSASKAVADHVRLLDQRRGDFDRLLDLYNYNWKATPWEFKELRSPLVNKDAIFRFESVPPAEGSSSFVGIVPISGGEITIVPLWDHGLRPIRNVELDPHNIAIFNALIVREQPTVRTDSDRLNLAVLYLHFFETEPTILSETNLKSILGKISTEAAKSLLPLTQLGADGTFEVQVFQQTAPDSFAEISFSFDRTGMLRNLTKETKTKADLLDGG